MFGVFFYSVEFKIFNKTISTEFFKPFEKFCFTALKKSSQVRILG